MNRFLVSLSAWLLLALAGLSLPLHAQSAPGDAQGDYVRMEVPDLHQAVTFFRDVMNCTVLSADAPTAAAPATELALMDCSPDVIVELSSGNGATPRKTAPVQVAFAVNDATAAAAWLRSNHITVLHEGLDANKRVVSFLAPWGQPLRLVGPGDSLNAGSARLAAQ